MLPNCCPSSSPVSMPLAVNHLSLPATSLSPTWMRLKSSDQPAHYFRLAPRGLGFAAAVVVVSPDPKTGAPEFAPKAGEGVPNRPGEGVPPKRPPVDAPNGPGEAAGDGLAPKTLPGVDAPLKTGVAGVPNAGVLAPNNGVVVDPNIEPVDAPNSGVVVDPNIEPVDAPNNGVVVDPNTGPVDPNGTAVSAEAGDAPKAGKLVWTGDPNRDCVWAGVDGAPNIPGDEPKPPVEAPGNEAEEKPAKGADGVVAANKAGEAGAPAVANWAEG
eukprot:TRINITY_DN5971_c0_g1_i1.p2 TRINITY_DN5971_c0_g1~~TRINITY_DN5971_c0_g1_i1.p2  ORF type:complete len:270 (-),score=41.46 TRINITY_DN5971_c0_g1_i1:182-991(-)